LGKEQRKQKRIGTLKRWRNDNPERIKLIEKEANDEHFFRHFVALDSEGQDRLGNVIEWNGVPYEDHEIFLWGAATIDESTPPNWLVNPATTDDDKRAID